MHRNKQSAHVLHRGVTLHVTLYGRPVNKKMYPNVSTVVKVLVVIPVTSVNGKKIKSALKYLNDHA